MGTLGPLIISASLLGGIISGKAKAGDSST